MSQNAPPQGSGPPTPAGPLPSEGRLPPHSGGPGRAGYSVLRTSNSVHHSRRQSRTGETLNRSRESGADGQAAPTSSREGTQRPRALPRSPRRRDRLLRRPKPNSTRAASASNLQPIPRSQEARPPARSQRRAEPDRRQYTSARREPRVGRLAQPGSHLHHRTLPSLASRPTMARYNGNAPKLQQRRYHPSLRGWFKHTPCTGTGGAGPQPHFHPQPWATRSRRCGSSSLHRQGESRPALRRGEWHLSNPSWYQPGPGNQSERKRWFCVSRSESGSSQRDRIRLHRRRQSRNFRRRRQLLLHTSGSDFHTWRFLT